MAAEQTTFRSPVPGTVMKRRLPCIDVDAADPDAERLIGSTCRNQYLALAKGVKFTCPNKGGSNGCEAGAFLYPRKRTDKYFHFHQGIDLGQLAPGVQPPEGDGAKGLPILSVTDGIVVHTQEWDGVSSGYGTSVGIYHEASQRLFWYAHCKENSITVVKGERVAEGQVVAAVGNTGKAGGPHLHFEVIDSPLENRKPRHTRIVGGEPWERELGNKKKSPRLDPLKVLEELGPWGPKQVFEPLAAAPFDSKLAALLHHAVEVGSYGGYFPLGANNFWHGGVHIPMPQGSLVHAPCDGTIVAARLAPSEASGSWTFGHTSFILIRHEVPQTVFERMQKGPDAPKSAPEPAGPKSGKIGVGYKVTDPSAVNQVKARLHELGYYVPADPARLNDGKVEAEFGEAIEAFQSTIDNPYKKHPEQWPDGVVEVSGHTWNHLFPAEDASEESAAPAKSASDSNRTIYCLLMHLQPLTLKEARTAGIEWVERARLPAGSDAAAEAPAEPDEAPTEDLRDREEAEAHRIKADVAYGSNNTADIEWVERRLITLGFLTTRTEPTGVADADLDAAIKAFQAEHPWPGKSANWDGVVEKGGKTDKFLRKTAFELAEKKQDAPAGGGKHEPIDPAFAAALAKLDRYGLAEVVSGLDVRISGGKPLWKSGRAASFNEAGGQELRQELHWEVFSEELLLPSWDVVNDQDDDLHADLPATILERVDLVPDKIVSESEIFMFYQSDACHDLRRTACRFRSEWNLDLDRTIGRLDELQFSTFGLWEALEPYQWWEKARDVLPANVTHVWHYNPIEFFRAYQESLEGTKPAPPPAPQDPETHGELIVRVLGANGTPPKQTVTVILSADMASYAGAETDKAGIAKFQGLALGTYDVSIEGVDGVTQLAEVQGYMTTEVTLQTSLEGKPEQRGDLTVWVRKATGGAPVGAQVTITGEKLDREFGTLVVGKKSLVVFEDIRGGEYRLHVVYPENPTHPNERVEADEVVNFEGTKKKVRIKVPRGWSDVVVHHDDRGAPVAGTVFDEHGTVVQTLTTGGFGLAAFRVRLGKYKVELGGRKKTLDIRLPVTDVTI
ncbi:peptidoglycan DD-metalloendopeptidase family protein [Nannocystis sp. ILAH1]|uniref:peptidoglycan DD-metalloendopeptidase family protein n=1 Tax=Nannocystis sp. ILAH1 TaxID=2996789 RepID=UPI0022717A82|nr:peptidoglycan DD-metalloendopeptidase family protein [Nannocystis sp. ILAH1]MCY0989515.1 peptidoglycan DD-metalloendopeptidase family protein [Nannocystis sp. ILAH1]